MEKRYLLLYNEIIFNYSIKCLAYFATVINYKLLYNAEYKSSLITQFTLKMNFYNIQKILPVNNNIVIHKYSNNII